MSPLAHNTIANPTLELTSTRPAAAVALSATEAAPPSSHAAGATLILDAFGPGTRRQLELTVNALSRSFRKAIRHAERLERDNAPLEEQDAAWERVEHRSALLQDFLKSLALPAAIPASETAYTSTPAPELTAEPADPAAPALVRASNQRPPQPAPKTPSAARALTSEEAALFTEYLAEFRRVRALPVSCRAERRRQERAGHQLITNINRQGDAFANRMYEAMKEIDAQEQASS